MQQKPISFIVLGAITMLLFLSSVFTVKEGQNALLLRLGQLTVDSSTGQAVVLGPGLHFKWPVINQVRVFDTRMQTLDIKSSRIVTREKKDVMVDYYVKWRIQDLAAYFKTTGGNAFQADTLLEQQFNTILRAQFGKRNISDLVSGERDDVMAILRERGTENAKSLGIKIVDVRVKGIDLPSNASMSVYKRMRADMQKIANRHRADGQAEAEATRAAADAKVTVILATARSNANVIKAKGQAEAAQIYTDAYRQSPDFFAFYRSLRAYENTFNNKQDILVLSPQSQFFNYFNSFNNTQEKH